MANLLPAKSRDSIIQGLHECFAVDKNVVKAILDSENWNSECSVILLRNILCNFWLITLICFSFIIVEKCLVGLEALSPKVIKGKMKKSNKTGQSANKAQENEAKPSNKASSSITPSKSNLKTPAKEKKKQNIQVVKQNKSKGAGDSGPSLQKNTDTKTGTKQIPSKVPEPDAELSKKKKRAALKSTYENTKLKPKVEDRISDCIKHEIKIVILMRGCPGSGKSTYAHKLLKQNGILNPEEHIFSTDNFFLDSKGNYIYCKNDLEKAHSWNQDLVEKVMKIGLSPVVVDNTHVKAWEMMCYVQFAVRLGYVLETLEPRTPWFNNESTLAKKNSHGVPKDKISSMLQNYDANLCGSDLFVKFNIAYSINQAPPQGVNYSKDSVLTAMNKAMGKRKLPIVDPSKSGNTQTSVSKNITKNTLATNSETITSLKNNKSDTISTESFEKSTSEVVTNASFPVPAIRKREIVSAIKMTSGNILRPIPLAQLSNSKEKESIKHPTVSSVNALDNIEFPSLSSNTSSSKKFDNANELAKSKIVEEKVNKITELFPHLDKEYIKKLCSDPHKELHDIVGIILLNSKIKEPEQLPEDAIDQDCESDSDIDSIEIEQIYEKDVSTLVQLFPDLSENDVKSIYRKCKYDFRSALECLLSSNCSDSDPFEFEEVYSVELPVSSPSDRSSRIEITSPDNDLKSCNISKDSSNTSERSSCKDSELSKTGGDCIINSDRNESQTDKITRLQQTDQENNIVNSSATPSSTKIIDIFNENNATCVSADIEYPTSSHFGSSADNKKVDVLSFLKPNSSEFVSSDSSNSRRFTDDSVHESLLSRNTNDFSRKSDVFNVFVNNEGKDSICPSNPVSEIRSTSSNLNSEYQNLKPKPSELINKLLDWNINDDKSTAVQCDRGVTSPKDQRDQYNPLNFLVHHTYTNTNYKDFALLKRAQNADIYPEKVLCGTFNFVGSSKPTENPVPKNKLTLDKGTSTMDVESNFNQSYDKKVVVLASMFPGVSLSDLESLLASCMGDLNWAVGLLLDSNLPVSPDFNSSELEVAPKNEGAQTEPSETVRPSDDAPLSSESPHLSKNKKTKHRIPVDGINYVMNDDSMSNHVKKIRNARLGIVETEENLSDPVDGPTTPFVVYDEWTESMEECEEEDDESLAIALSMDFVQTLQAQFGGYVPKVLPG